MDKKDVTQGIYGKWHRDRKKVSSKALFVDIRGDFKITERKFRKMSIINENLPQANQQCSASPATLIS